ncbi:MAG: isochorismatase family protein, partial [Balneolaceae bacterium]
ATDFCVKWSVLDGIREGFNVTVIEDAVRGIDLEGSVDEAWKEMEEAGAHIVRSDEIDN